MIGHITVGAGGVDEVAVPMVPMGGWLKTTVGMAPTLVTKGPVTKGMVTKGVAAKVPYLWCQWVGG